ncbi:MAG: DNA polymerase IV [Methanomicrobiales archaeon]|nr:DNA polymerase IV [Methanomicrobiales archaeon]
MAGPDPIIFHVDMDSFYASVEVREHPEYAGRPVIVGADPKGGLGRGVVSTCSYEARKFGIHSAMPISHAYQRCPDAVFICPHFELYEQASQSVMRILRQYSPVFEQVSIDEAYLDMSHLHSFEAAQEKAQEIKNEIREQERLACSIGIAAGRTLAKIASDHSKPDGLLVVTPEGAASFLAPLPVEKIPGIGKKSARALHEMGIFTIGQLAFADIQGLIAKFGRSAVVMRDLARGIDRTSIRIRETSRSLSREMTYEQDTRDIPALQRTLDGMAQELAGYLSNERMMFKTVTVKIRYQGFDTRTKARTIEKPREDFLTIRAVAWQLFSELYDGRLVRLIGLKLSGLQSGDRSQTKIDDFSDSPPPLR